MSGSSSVSITGALHIAKLDNGAIMPTGTVYMAGGKLECDTLNIGSHGNGSLIQNSGDVHVLTGGITVGLSDAAGELHINGGALQTIDSFLNIGHTDSFGLVTISNGTVNIDGTTSIGSSSRGQGKLDLYGGLLSTDQFFIGPAVSATGALNLYGGELFILETENSALQISNGYINLQQTLFHWANTNVTERITHAVQNSTLHWSNGFANGTFSTNGFDGSLTNGNGILFWDNQDNGSQFSTSTIWAEQLAVSPYDLWISSYQLSESNALWSADPDLDQLDNLTEFALGGNPTNTVGEMILPMLSPDSMGYIYRQRSNPNAFGLCFYPEQCTDLIRADWTTNGFTPDGIFQSGDGFAIITNRMSSPLPTNLFLRLQIELK